MSCSARNLVLPVLTLEVEYNGLCQGGRGAGRQEVVDIDAYSGFALLVDSVEDTYVLRVWLEADLAEKA